MNRLTRSALAACTLLLTACLPKYTAEVESNTSWSGSFGGASVDGNGNRKIELPNDDPQCIVVQKNTQAGNLRARVVVENGGFFGLTGPSSGEWVSTTAAYGVVSACSQSG